ncbi:MAG: hypothetical protein IJR66_01135 [Clostridia bacterium]|nr:hypothetical protein [Clostridia bacterium]
MKNIIISDTSIKDSIKNQSNFSFKEKLEIAKQLSELNVDVIELGEVKSKADEVLYKTICALIKNTTVAINVSDEKALEKNFSLIKSAKNKKIVLSVPVSPVQMEYELGKKPAVILDAVTNLTKKATACCQDVEVEFTDATRADPAFLYQAITNAVNGGATCVSIIDNAGISTPKETEEFIDGIYKNVEGLDKVIFGVQFSNLCSFAIVNTLYAMNCGARQVKISAVNNQNYFALKDFALVMDTIGAKHGFSFNIKKTSLGRVLQRIESLFVNNNTSLAIIGDKESKELSKDITEEKLRKVISSLGYDLSDDDFVKVYQEVKRIESKKAINTKDLEAIISNTALQVPETYVLDRFSVNSSNVLTATASIVLIKDKKQISGLSYGNGAIDAAFLALEKIVGEHFELEDFEISAVTEGKEAVGQAIIKLRSDGKRYSGKGISTDIIGACIRAYINAVNKIVYERNN